MTIKPYFACYSFVDVTIGRHDPCSHRIEYFILFSDCQYQGDFTGNVFLKAAHHLPERFGTAQ